MGFSAAAAALGVFGGAYMASKQQTPNIPAPAAAAAAPESQAAKTPDTLDVLKSQMGTGQAGGNPGVAQTFLTGAGGIDPNSLNLKKNSLLG